MWRQRCFLRCNEAGRGLTARNRIIRRMMPYESDGMLSRTSNVLSGSRQTTWGCSSRLARCTFSCNSTYLPAPRFVHNSPDFQTMLSHQGGKSKRIVGSIHKIVVNVLLRCQVADISQIPILKRPCYPNGLLDSNENALGRRESHPFPLQRANPSPGAPGTRIPSRFGVASTFRPHSNHQLFARSRASAMPHQRRRHTEALDAVQDRCE